MKLMKIYLASPFFNTEEVAIYRNVINDLRNAGHEVYVPQEHTIENAWDLSNRDWAEQVYLNDIEAIRECEMVIILNFGMYSDSGTAWEAGYAYATEKKTVQVLCGGSNTTYSLMMMNGCDKVISLGNLIHFEEWSSWANFDKVIQK